MKLNSIQCLRALAALLVVYAHAIDVQTKFSDSYQQHFFFLENFGAIGVDLFFVISGFIITYVAHTYNGIKQGFHFLVKRFKRVNPAYYIASAIYLAGYLLNYQLKGKLDAKEWNNIFQSIADTLLILPRSGNKADFDPILVIGWTLSFEWFFYILFFLLILTGVKHKPVWLGLLIAGLVALGYFFKAPDFRYLFITNAVMAEFLSGVVICYVWMHLKKIPSWLAFASLAIGIAGYILLIVHGFGLISEQHYTLTGQLSGQRFLKWGIPSAFIVFGCLGLENNKYFGRLWNNRLFLLMGDASYSIYLVHFTVFAVLIIFYERVGFFLPGDVAIIVQVAIAILVSMAFYKWVEKPLLRSIHRKPAMEKAPVATPVQ